RLSYASSFHSLSAFSLVSSGRAVSPAAGRSGRAAAPGAGATVPAPGFRLAACLSLHGLVVIGTVELPRPPRKGQAHFLDPAVGNLRQRRLPRVVMFLVRVVRRLV